MDTTLEDIKSTLSYMAASMQSSIDYQKVVLKEWKENYCTSYAMQIEDLLIDSNCSDITFSDLTRFLTDKERHYLENELDIEIQDALSEEAYKYDGIFASESLDLSKVVYKIVK